MAFFPSAVTEIKQQPSFLQQAGEAMQLKSLAGQQQIQDLTVQQMQQQMEDRHKISEAFMQNNGNMDATIESVRKAGLNDPNQLIELQKQNIAQKTAIQGLQDKALATHQATVKALGDAAQSVLALPDELQSAAYQRKTQELSQQIGIDPKQIPPYSKDSVRMMAAESMGLKSLLDTESENRLKAAQLLKAQSEATISGQEAALTPQERAGLKSPEQAEMADYLKKNPGKGPSDFVVWKAQHSPAVIQQTLPAGMSDPMVDLVGQNRIDYATAVQRMTPAAKAQFTKDLAAKYPNYSQAEFGVEKKVQETFTSGEGAKNLTAFNTAIEHAKQLDEAAKAMSIGDVRTLNKIGNALGYEFGSDRTTNFNVIKSALTGEISKVFKGGQATDAEIREVQGPFDAANSPAQLRGAIQNAVRLMNSKRDALKQQYEQGRQGKPNFGEETQHVPGGKATGLKEGATGTGSDGKKYVVKGGVWVPQ